MFSLDLWGEGEQMLMNQEAIQLQGCLETVARSVAANTELDEFAKYLDVRNKYRSILHHHHFLKDFNHFYCSNNTIFNFQY